MSAREPRGRPPIVLARLWVKESAKGQKYLAGRLGATRVLVMSNRDRKSGDDPSHLILLAEIGERGDRGGGAR